MRLTTKRIGCILFLLYVFSLFMIPTKVNASETVLSTHVPNNCVLKIILEGKGIVKIGNVSYNKNSTIEVQRLSKYEILFVPDFGYEVGRVNFNNQEITDQIMDGKYELSGLQFDSELQVTFKKNPESPATGLTNHSAENLVLLIVCLSVILLIFNMKKIREILRCHVQNITFLPEEKIKLFDEIASHFYNFNFGHMSKSDMELMMFHFYMEKLQADSKEIDGTINYSKCSDYRISKELGITQQRVRNLKVKDRLIYPNDYKWEAEFAQLIKNARYDKVTNRITLNIPDPNLYLEIQNFIEESGAYVEKQLNSKILQLRAEYFIDLVVAVESEETRKKVIKNLRKQLKADGKDDTAFDENRLGKSLIDLAVNISSVASNLTGILSPVNEIGGALMGLLMK